MPTNNFLSLNAPRMDELKSLQTGRHLFTANIAVALQQPPGFYKLQSLEPKAKSLFLSERKKLSWLPYRDPFALTFAIFPNRRTSQKTA